MNYKELDEYIAKYGNDNETGIEDISIAMDVNKIRKDKEYVNNIRNDRTGSRTS